MSERHDTVFLQSLFTLPFWTPGGLHGNGRARKSPGNQFKFPYSYWMKPRDPFLATCRAQTSCQPPLALPDASSHCLLGFLHIFKYTITSYIKAFTATSKRREATSRGAWEFFISKLPVCRHYITKCSIHLQFYVALESAQRFFLRKR